MAVQVRKTYSLGEFALDPDKKRLARDGAALHRANRPFIESNSRIADSVVLEIT